MPFHGAEHQCLQLLDPYPQASVDGLAGSSLTFVLAAATAEDGDDEPYPQASVDGLAGSSLTLVLAAATAENGDDECDDER